MTKNLVLVGGGGHCLSCIDVIEQTKQFRIVGILDVTNKVGSRVSDYPVLGTDENIEEHINKDCAFIVTIGQIRSVEARLRIFSRLKKSGALLPTIISPRSYVSRFAELGQGTIIMHDVIVNANATVGENCIINTKAIIEHGANVGDHCHISTAAVINGDCVVSSKSFVGSNAVCVEGTFLKEESFVKAGSLYRSS
ncbi:MAG: NeuD/PglB/VioB family sugar acetyltransferase [Gammaproteobacteria bacterium]|nr:NeuD/PglB/VioB family sugar acetyltransferase [Gammaproteobacteria bacterium]